MEQLEQQARTNDPPSRVADYVLEMIAANIRKYLDSGMSVSDMSQKMIGALQAITEAGNPPDDDPVVMKVLEIVSWQEDK